MAYQFKLQTRYDFTLYENGTLPLEYKGVLVRGIVDYEQAKKVSDVRTIHASIYPELRESSVSDDITASGIEFIIIELWDKKITALAVPWIREESIKVTEVNKVNITLRNVTSADVRKITELLLLNGYQPPQIDIVGESSDG